MTQKSSLRDVTKRENNHKKTSFYKNTTRYTKEESSKGFKDFFNLFYGAKKISLEKKMQIRGGAWRPVVCHLVVNDP